MGRDQGGRMRRRICRGGIDRRGVWKCVWSSGVVFSGGILVLWSRVGVGVGEAERQELGQFRRLRFGFGHGDGSGSGSACPSETRREIDLAYVFFFFFFFSAHYNNYMYGMLTLCYLDLFIRWQSSITIPLSPCSRPLPSNCLPPSHR
jgi:hypothetical protein